MLAIVRRHVSLGLKLILGVIVVSFTFYFGFTQLADQGGQASALQVGSEEISGARFRFFYDDFLKRSEEAVKEEGLSLEETRRIKSETAQRLVVRSLLKQFAQLLGFQVTDQELAEKITSQEEFDPVNYRLFLKNFFQENAFSYEELVREDLLITKFQDWARNTEKLQETTPEETSPEGEPQWTFETLQMEGEEKKDLAGEIQKAWAKGQSGSALLKKNKLEAKKVGPVAVDKRFLLFPEDLTLEDYLEIFSLTPTKPALDKPFTKGDRFLLLRLVKKELPKKKKRGAKEEPAPEESWRPEFSLIDTWFQEFKKDVQIRSYLSADE